METRVTHRENAKHGKMKEYATDVESRDTFNMITNARKETTGHTSQHTLKTDIRKYAKNATHIDADVTVWRII